MRENKSNMPALVRAEHLKMKHTFVRILPAASALMALFLVFSFAPGIYFAVSAWNWWYTMLLPGMLAVLCYLVIKREKKLHYCNLLSSRLHRLPACLARFCTVRWRFVWRICFLHLERLRQAWSGEAAFRWLTLLQRPHC